MLSAVLVATTTVLGAAVLGLLWLRFTPSSGSKGRSEEPQVPFRATVEEMLVRLANVESKLAVFASEMDGILKDTKAANERANYHANRSKAIAAEIREYVGGLADEDDDVRGEYEGGGEEQGVLPLRAGMADRDRGDEQPGRIDPLLIARMNG